MSKIGNRVVVYIKNKDVHPIPVLFEKSLTCLLGSEGNKAKVYCCLSEGKLILSENKITEVDEQVQLTRPSFCPIYNMTNSILAQIPKETLTRGVDCGSVAILETSDGYVLLLRRAKNLRTFPNIWVPPGGHIENNENLVEAALRECQEETGLIITSDMCVNQKCSILTLWESVYPPLLSAGFPKRHHAVVYIHVPLTEPYTKNYLDSKLHPDPVEVSACAWFDKKTIQAIVDTSPYGKKYENLPTPEEIMSQYGIEKRFSATVIVSDEGNTEKQEIPTALLLNEAPPSEKDIERVSTGTKYALSEWLKLLK